MQKQLVIDEDKAKEMYSSADTNLKSILEETFGKKHFMPKVTDRVKTFEDACREVGEYPDDAKFNSDTQDEIAYKKIKVIAAALNEGVVLSFANHSQRKWRPWFQHDGTAFRFGGSGCAFVRTHSAGGSRLCFASEELSNYAGKQFIDLYNQLLN